jgi:hypothetical protein
MNRNRSSSSATADATEMDIEREQKHPLADAGHEAGETAGHLAERAADVGLQQADRAREQTASGLNQLADSVRRVSTDMESEQPGIANLATTAAEQTERMASFLRDTDARQLIHSVEDVARRQPLLFVGGAFLLGVAASRFIKAAGGGSQGRDQHRVGYRSGGHSTDYRAAGYGSGVGAYGAATGPGGSRMGDTDDRFADAGDEGLRP